MPSTTELSPDELDREELELLQRHALRSWQHDPELARERPREALELDDFPEGEVWLDVDEGATPGTIGVGPGRTLNWNFRDSGRIPARARTVDKLYAGGLPTGEDALENALDDFARVLKPGGLLYLKGALDTLRPKLQARGFTTEGNGVFTLAQTSTKLEDAARPLIRDTVLGRTGPTQVRTPRETG